MERFPPGIFAADAIPAPARAQLRSRRPPATFRKLQFAAVVGPVQQGLALTATAGKVTRLAVALDLTDMPAHGLPALDLPRILVRATASQIVSAVPLEPASRVVGVQPALPTPLR